MDAALKALPSSDEAHLVCWNTGFFVTNADCAVAAARDLGGNYLNGLQPPLFDSDIAAAYADPANDPLYNTGSGEGSGEQAVEPDYDVYMNAVADRPDFASEADRLDRPSGPE
jgi:hypothetical protein